MPFAVDRRGEEGIDPRVDFLAKPTELALGDPGSVHRLHEIVHGSCLDAMGICFLYHGRQRLLGGTPGLQDRRDVAAGAQPGNAQLHAARPGVPIPVTVSITLRKTLFS